MILLKRWTLLLIAPVLMITSCKSDSSSDDDLVGNWMNRFSFNGNARSEAVNFTIGDKSYVGTGWNDENKRLKDFWEYDSQTNLWRRVKDFPGLPISSGIAFSVNNKGYVGTGFDDNGDRRNEFYEFTPPVNATDSGSWVRINDFPGTARQEATGFAIGNKGYLLGGFDGSYLKDFWEFTPGAGVGGMGEWVEKSFPGNKRQSATVFIIDNKAYFGTGVNNGIAMTDFWEFDPATGWLQKRDIANVKDDSFDDDYTTITRGNAAAFSIGNVGFITTGDGNSDCWSYDHVNDLWIKKTAFEGQARSGALGLTVAGKGFIMTGRNGNVPNDDFWEFFPDAAQVDND